MIRNFEVRLFEPRAIRKRGSCRIGINFKGSTVYTSVKFHVGLWDWKSEGEGEERILEKSSSRNREARMLVGTCTGMSKSMGRMA